MQYEVIDETLPGKNGLNLVMGRRYDSEDARLYNPVGVNGGSSIENNRHSDGIYGLGIGWSFMFSSIEDDKYLLTYQMEEHMK